MGRCTVISLARDGEEVRGRSAYLPELSYAAIDPQRVRGDAGDAVARLAELAQRGGARRRAGV